MDARAAVLDPQKRLEPFLQGRGVAVAIEDGVTGIPHEPGDIDGIAKAITALAGDAPRRRTLGAAGRRRVREEFAHEPLTGEVVRFYAQTLGGRAALPARGLGGAPPGPGRPGPVPG